jgi:endonuclease/exonuclease/phosphatase family metal-dependent hydrolase
VGFSRLQPIEHALAPHYAALRALPDRRALLNSALWRQVGDEVERTVTAVERGDHTPASSSPEKPLRFVAWNIQRGTRFDVLSAVLRGDPVLAGADVLLLSEVDCGLGRSGNRNVARELAALLGMSYAFAPSYLTLEDDWGENRGATPNSTALAGTAILSRLPIRRAVNLDLPELRDKFSSSEKRLGKKRALLVELAAPGGPLLVAACHLDSNASPAQRARQLAAVLGAFDDDATLPAVLGGDFNSSTHDLSSALATVVDVLRKLVSGGARRMIDRYMTPENSDERPLFEALAARGFAVDGLNDRASATYQYDFNDPYAQQKLRRIGGGALVWLVRRYLRAWRGCVPARLDWFAGRHVRSLSAAVVRPRDAGGQPASDHAAIVCDVALPL